MSKSIIIVIAILVLLVVTFYYDRLKFTPDPAANRIFGVMLKP